MDERKISLVIPALNEEEGLGVTIDAATTALKEAGIEHEIIVVDDGSTDATGEKAKEKGARVLRHPAPLGYGHSILHGVREAKHDWVAIADADGTYPVEQFPEFVKEAEKGFEMVIGLRNPKQLRDGILKKLARRIFRRLAEFTSGTKIPDVNSGMRVFRRDMILNFAPSFGRGYSFSTTSTLLAILYGHPVKFVPIEYRKRHGKSKVRILRDSVIAAQILVEVILTHNPIKIFLPLAAAPAFAGAVATVLNFLPCIHKHAGHAIFWPTLACTGFAVSLLTLAAGFATTAMVRTAKTLKARPPEKD